MNTSAAAVAERPVERQPAPAFRCPLCGDELPAGVYWWERMAAVPGRRPAWQLRHRRRIGTWCVRWAGDALEDGAALDSVA